MIENVINYLSSNYILLFELSSSLFSILNKLKVYHLFWILSVCFLIAFYFLTETGSKYIDLRMGPNYYVISIFQLELFTLIAFLIQGFGYWFVLKILNKSLIKFLTLMHSIIFIGGIFCLWCVTYVPKFIFKGNLCRIPWKHRKGRWINIHSKYTDWRYIINHWIGYTNLFYKHNGEWLQENQKLKKLLVWRF